MMETPDKILDRIWIAACEKAHAEYMKRLDEADAKSPIEARKIWNDVIQDQSDALKRQAEAC